MSRLRQPDLLAALTQCGQQLDAEPQQFALLVPAAELPDFVARLRDAVCQDLQLLADQAWDCGQLRPIDSSQQLALPFHTTPVRPVGRIFTRLCAQRGRFRQAALAG